MPKYMFYEQKKTFSQLPVLVVKRKKNTHVITPAVRYFRYILACFFCVVFISICFIFHSISCFFLNITRRTPPFSLPNTKLQKSIDNTPKEETSDYVQRINNDYFAVYAIFIRTHITLCQTIHKHKKLKYWNNTFSASYTPPVCTFSEQVRHINLQEQGGAHITCNVN